MAGKTYEEFLSLGVNSVGRCISPKQYMKNKITIASLKNISENKMNLKFWLG